MQFIYEGGLYKVIRITGPSHNLLGLSFGDDNGDNVLDIEALQSDDGEGILTLEKNIKEQVLSGVNQANEELGTNYKVQKIQFVATDSPSDDVYKKLAVELIKYIEPLVPQR